MRQWLRTAWCSLRGHPVKDYLTSGSSTLKSCPCGFEVKIEGS